MMNDIERALAAEVAACFADPLRFVRLAFSWGEGELAGHSGPDAMQEDILRAVRDRLASPAEALRVAVASGHGVGKTALVAWLILWFMSTRVRCAGVVTANTRDQLVSKTWRELALWHRRAINAHWFRWTATRFAQVDHPDAWFVSAIPWNAERPEAFAGLHARDVLVIYDEASAIDDAIWEVSEGAMTTSGAMWFAFGNPTRPSGRFHDCFGRFRHRWVTRQVDSRGSRLARTGQIAQWIEDYGEDLISSGCGCAASSREPVPTSSFPSRSSTPPAAGRRPGSVPGCWASTWPASATTRPSCCCATATGSNGSGATAGWT